MHSLRVSANRNRRQAGARLTAAHDAVAFSGSLYDLLSVLSVLSAAETAVDLWLPPRFRPLKDLLQRFGFLRCIRFAPPPSPHDALQRDAADTIPVFGCYRHVWREVQPAREQQSQAARGAGEC